jgi:HK97 family phage prohead protease
MEKTKRVIDAYAKVETRKTAEGKMIIEGMIPFNSRSEVLWDFVEVIDPAAFNKTLADNANVYMFWAHDESDVLASRDAKTLTLNVDSIGLHFSAELRSGCADEFDAVMRGDVVGVSFGFITQKEEWDFNAEPAVRTLKEVQLLEISPGVAFPAYPGAQSAAALRTLEAERPHIAEMRSKYQAPAPSPEEKPLDATPEQPTALESRQRAELDLIRARFGLSNKENTK